MYHHAYASLALGVYAVRGSGGPHSRDEDARASVTRPGPHVPRPSLPASWWEHPAPRAGSPVHLGRAPQVMSVAYETYARAQEGDEERQHRPDILVRDTAEEHILDITVVNVYTGRGRLGDNPDLGYVHKQKEYPGIRNVHPIVFDVAGRLHTKSWASLQRWGIRKTNIRNMQALVFKYTAAAVRAARAPPSGSKKI